MSELLKRLVGLKVAVWSLDHAGNRDDGVLEEYDGEVLCLRVENVLGKPERLYFPITSVRLIKLLEER